MTKTPLGASPRLVLAAIAVTGLLATLGCAHSPRMTTPKPPAVPKGGPPVPAANKVVLKPGTQVVAETAEGRIKIEAGPGLRRIFDWDGLRRGAIIKPRHIPFAHGQTLGITFNGKPKVWPPANGITRLRYEEGRRYFQTMDDAMIWMQIRRLYFTYNDHGLVVGWKRQGHTLHVELWQFYIDGDKPTSMPGSQDARIHEGPLKVVPQKMAPQPAS